MWHSRRNDLCSILCPINDLWTICISKQNYIGLMSKQGYLDEVFSQWKIIVSQSAMCYDFPSVNSYGPHKTPESSKSLTSKYYVYLLRYPEHTCVPLRTVCWDHSQGYHSLHHLYSVTIFIALYFTVVQDLHQQNVFELLEASRGVWENVECKLRCINFRRVSDPERPSLTAFRVTGSADDDPGRTWEHRRHVCKHLESQ